MVWCGQLSSSVGILLLKSWSGVIRAWFLNNLVREQVQLAHNKFPSKFALLTTVRSAIVAKTNTKPEGSHL